LVVFKKWIASRKGAINELGGGHKTLFLVNRGGAMLKKRMVMGIKKCRQCGKEITSKVVKCPHCGASQFLRVFFDSAVYRNNNHQQVSNGLDYKDVAPIEEELAIVRLGYKVEKIPASEIHENSETYQGLLALALENKSYTREVGFSEAKVEERKPKEANLISNIDNALRIRPKRDLLRSQLHYVENAYIRMAVKDSGLHYKTSRHKGQRSIHIWLLNKSDNAYYVDPNDFTMVGLNNHSYHYDGGTFLAVDLQPGTKTSGYLYFPTTLKPKRLNLIRNADNALRIRPKRDLPRSQLHYVENAYIRMAVKDLGLHYKTSRHKGQRSIHVWLLNKTHKAYHVDPNDFTMVGLNNHSYHYDGGTFLAVTLQPGTKTSGYLYFPTTLKPKRLVFDNLWAVRISSDFPVRG
jgi:predicted lipid carrier protein YhbT/RNA polymerase subunit RPABC4/transcription elongation factor Spt4